MTEESQSIKTDAVRSSTSVRKKEPITIFSSEGVVRVKQIFGEPKAPGWYWKLEPCQIISLHRHKAVAVIKSCREAGEMPRVVQVIMQWKKSRKNKSTAGKR